MAKVRMVIELEYDDVLMYGDDADGKAWFFSEVLNEANGLELHSGHIADFIGSVVVLEKERIE